MTSGWLRIPIRDADCHKIDNIILVAYLIIKFFFIYQWVAHQHVQWMNLDNWNPRHLPNSSWIQSHSASLKPLYTNNTYLYSSPFFRSARKPSTSSDSREVWENGDLSRTNSYSTMIVPSCLVHVCRTNFNNFLSAFQYSNKRMRIKLNFLASLRISGILYLNFN